MRVLFDQGTPAPWRNYLQEHQVVTAFEMGWSKLSNGELIARAEEEFDVLVTTDKSLRDQQNLTRRKMRFWFCRMRTGSSCDRTWRRQQRLSLQCSQAAMSNLI